MTKAHEVWGGLSVHFEVLSRAVLYWPLLLIVIGLISPVSPHLRLTDPLASSCVYVGARGILHEYRDAPCPLIDLIDTRGRGQW